MDAALLPIYGVGLFDVLVKKIFQYSSTALALIAFLFVSYGIYSFLDNKKEEYEKWLQISYEFKNCEMFYTLRKMGYSNHPLAGSDTYFSFPDAYAQLREPLVDLLTAGMRDGRITGLDQVWLDPNLVGSIGTSQLSEASLNFFDQCKKSIDNGREKIWLDVGIYYLLIGNKDSSIEWLESAGENNIPDALVLLGHAYKNGLLTGFRDDQTASNYYRRAAGMGSIKGKFYYSQMIREDLASSVAYLESAASLGSISSAYRLATLFTPWPQDRYFWALIFEGLLNDMISMPIGEQINRLRTLAVIHERHIEYPLDGIPKRAWTSSGEEGTVLRYQTVDIDRLGANLTPQQRIEVQKQVSEWFKNVRARTGSGN